MAVRRHLPLSFDQADINDVIVLMRAMSPEQPCGECVRITKNLREQQIMIYREATNDDAPAVAALHAESWRRNYRGVYRDEYLDGDILVLTS